MLLGSIVLNNEPITFIFEEKNNRERKIDKIIAIGRVFCKCGFSLPIDKDIILSNTALEGSKIYCRYCGRENTLTTLTLDKL